MAEKALGKSKRREKKDQAWCPYCDEEIVDSNLPYCQACTIPEFHCPECGHTIPRGEEVCPSCKFNIRKQQAK